MLYLQLHSELYQSNAFTIGFTGGYSHLSPVGDVNFTFKINKKTILPFPYKTHGLYERVNHDTCPNFRRSGLILKCNICVILELDWYNTYQFYIFADA